MTLSARSGGVAIAVGGGSPGNAPTRRAPWSQLPTATRAALLEVLIHGALPRAEIARRLGLSRASLTRITRELLDAGLLREGETERRGATGRPSEMLHLREQSRHFLGIKLTGDALYAVVTDLGASVVASHEEPLSSRRVDDVVGQIARVTADFALAFPLLDSIGVCLAGQLGRSTGHIVIQDSPFLGWSEVALAELVAEATGFPCDLENDVQALTAAEYWFGAGAGLDSMAMITVGTGLGFGLIVNGGLVEGAHRRAGRIAHLMIDSNGPLCDHGHHGCASSYLTTAAILAAIDASAGTAGVDEATAIRLARQGDAAATRAFDAAGWALGVMIARVVNLVDPACVVLSGDGIAVYELAAERVQAGLQSALAWDAAPVEVAVRQFDFSEWARAGAVLAIRRALVTEA
jgi:predicted NBD/HSP70 family sugar kinase